MRAKSKDEAKLNPFAKALLLGVLFFLPFLISNILTADYFERKNAVSLEEEVEFFEKALNAEELTQLYGKNINSDKVKVLPKNKVVILGYHQIREIESIDGPKTRLFITSPKIFEKEMKLLKDKGYTSISLVEYINHLKNEKENPIPEKSVVITFDDGYVTQYTEAFPILKKYGMKATLFLYMDCIDKYPVCLSSLQIKEMLDSGITVANHTLRHTFLPEQRESIIKKEILDNQNLLEKTFGEENVEKVLAYPYGGQNEKIKFLVQNLGYLGAVGVTGGTGKDAYNIFNLDRYLMGDKIEFFEELFKD